MVFFLSPLEPAPTTGAGRFYSLLDFSLLNNLLQVDTLCISSGVEYVVDLVLSSRQSTQISRIIWAAIGR